jgi:hypothetical protein
MADDVTWAAARSRTLIAEFTCARIGRMFNQYAEGPRASLLRRCLSGYLEARATACVMLVGEAPG